MHIDRATCKTLRERLNAKLTELQREFPELDFKVGSGTFTDSEVKFKLEIKNNGTGDSKSTDEIQYERNRTLYGLPAYGYQFTWGTNLYSVVGYDTRKPKYPVLAVSVATGKRFKFPRNVLPQPELTVIPFTPRTR